MVVLGVWAVVPIASVPAGIDIVGDILRGVFLDGAGVEGAIAWPSLPPPSATKALYDQRINLGDIGGMALL